MAAVHIGGIYLIMVMVVLVDREAVLQVIAMGIQGEAVLAHLGKAFLVVVVQVSTMQAVAVAQAQQVGQELLMVRLLAV
jgi:hypothetical protein